jgi:hypothetical protein
MEAWGNPQRAARVFSQASKSFSIAPRARRVGTRKL